jgi:sugar transferase (PEP-CTERM/EpsH1 system associated)
MSAAAAPTRHIVHLVHGFGAGGLENVVAQLVDGLPPQRFRHTVLALTTIDPAFAARIRRQDVGFVALNKPPGQPYGLVPRMVRLLRELRPQVLHSCNIAALEFAPVAAWAGVPWRVHAEHGWDVADPDGSNRRYRLIRRLYAPFAHRIVAVSQPIADYLVKRVGLAQRKVVLIRNGVDLDRFHLADPAAPAPADFPFSREQHWVFGSVGRLEPIKNHALLLDAFARLVRTQPVVGGRAMRLALVGSGVLREALMRQAEQAGIADRLWMPGSRDDVPALLRAMDGFVMPSLAEGTSCTVQEAMASGLPVIATEVGGNADLLEAGRCGVLVRSGDAQALAAAMQRLASRADEAAAFGARAAASARAAHSLAGVVRAYDELFSMGPAP